jgi:hypothetical protein
MWAPDSTYVPEIVEKETFEAKKSSFETLAIGVTSTLGTIPSRPGNE